MKPAMAVMKPIIRKYPETSKRGPKTVVSLMNMYTPIFMNIPDSMHETIDGALGVP